MANRERYTVAQVREALDASAGIRLGAAKLLGCAPNTIKNMIDKHESLQQAEIDIVESNLDIAEDTVQRAIRAGDVKTACWYLDRKGGGRGFSNRPAVAVAVATTTTVLVVSAGDAACG